MKPNSVDEATSGSARMFVIVDHISAIVFYKRGESASYDARPFSIPCHDLEIKARPMLGVFTSIRVLEFQDDINSWYSDCYGIYVGRYN